MGRSSSKQAGPRELRVCDSGDRSIPYPTLILLQFFPYCSSVACLGRYWAPLALQGRLAIVYGFLA